METALWAIAFLIGASWLLLVLCGAFPNVASVLVSVAVPFVCFLAALDYSMKHAE